MTIVAGERTQILFAAAVDAAARQLAPLRSSAIHVSGASGFLASNLLALLHAASEWADLGLRLFASARRPPYHVPLFRYLGIDLAAEWEIAPVEASVLPDVPGLVVVHAASFGAPADYAREPLATFRANTDGLVGLFDQAARVRAGHVLYFSSAEVYGQPPVEAIPTGEDYRGGPELGAARSIYGESKRMAEVLGAVLAEEHGIPFTAVRPWNLYGPGQRLGDGRVPFDFMRQALVDGAVTLASDGTPRRCFAFVWSTLLQVIACLRPQGAVRAFNVGNPAEEVTMLELARRCADAAGLPAHAVEVDPAARASGLMRCVPDVDAVLGAAQEPLQDATPLADGLVALREWVEWSLADARP
jgi:UDP-glucuronate decarboxylase